MLNLNSFQIPDINRPGLSTEDQVKLIQRAFLALQEQLTQILSTLNQDEYDAQISDLQKQIDTQQEQIKQLAKALQDHTNAPTE